MTLLRPVRMAHLRVQVPASEASAATRCIAREGLLHLVDLAHGRIPGLSSPQGTSDLLAAFRDLARRIRQVGHRLGGEVPGPSGRLGDVATAADLAEEREALELRLRPVEGVVDEAWRAAQAGRDRAARAREALRRARALREAGVDVARLAGLRFTDLRLGVAREADLAQLASLVDPAPFAVVPLAPEEPGWLFAAAVPASARERLDAALRAVACQPLPLPATPAAWDPAALELEIAEAEGEERRSREALAAARAQAEGLLPELLRRAEVAILLLQAQTCFAAAGRFVIISGWVPAAEAARLQAAIVAATGGRAVVDVEQPEELVDVESGYLKVPILHHNPLLLRPFRRLVQLYGTPSYQEVEPTAFFAVSFLVMFGLMFGDIGHGAVLFSAGYFLFRWFPRFLDYGILLMEGGAASVLFGALYGSVFGIEDLLPALWLRPMHDLTTFMAVATAIGVVLVSAGLVLNVVNTWRAGQRSLALFGPRGLFGAFLYWVALALVARALLPRRFTLPPWALLALAAAPFLLIVARPLIARPLGAAERRPRERAAPRWLGALEGSIELVDTVFSFFTNTLSFVRIAAFAAVHAGICVALFTLADTLAQLRFGGPISVLALVAGNVGMIFLEGLTVSVQVLRLEYYEFFSRFFRGGGEPYRPLELPADKGDAHARKAGGARRRGDRDAAGHRPRVDVGAG